MAQRSNRRLAKFSEEHVAYEIWMLFVTGQALQQNLGDAVRTNVLVESFGMHVRNVTEFLYGTRRRDDDVGAEEYVGDRKTWMRARGGQPRRLKAATRRAGKQLNHLTLKRYRSGPRKGWPVAALLADLQRPLSAFVQHAVPARLHRKVRQLIHEFYADPQT